MYTMKSGETSIVDKYVNDPTMSTADVNQLTNRRQTRQVDDDVMYVVISGLSSDVRAHSLGLVSAATT